LIFVDTSYWVALRMRRDSHHEAAAALFAEHRTSALITTTLVVGETWTFLNRRSGRAAALDFLDRVEAAERLDVLSLAADHETEAFAFLRRRDEREYSYVDATSFAIMRGLRVRRALAFDGDFAAAGFDELRPSI
jgi:predicted nucleic acid-binding protein